MNILWIVNIIFPFPANILKMNNITSGGWLLGLYDELKKKEDINLAIATVYHGKKLRKIIDNKTVYYLLPYNGYIKKQKKLQKNWQLINEDFKPDLVHIHGSEYPYGLAFQKACPRIKNIVSIQGLLSVYHNYYIPNIKYDDIIKNFSFRCIIKGNMIKEQKMIEKKSKYEKETLKKTNAIIGRTTWDYANSLAITGTNKYFFCNENLRKIFYGKSWNINNIEEKTIFVSNSEYPPKGFHIMIEALNILRKKYKNIKVYVAGKSIFDTKAFIDKIKFSNYQKYILNLIKKYDLFDNIIFTGPLNENQVLELLLKSNVYVQTSSIENSSNALGEAMLIGMPCIASDVGGTSDLLKNKEEGYLYPFGDYGLLAFYISEIFENSKNAVNMGANAKKHANETYNYKRNTKEICDIYLKVINGKE